MRLWDRVGWIEVDEGIRHVARMHAPNCWRHCRPRFAFVATSTAAEEEEKVTEVGRICESASGRCIGKVKVQLLVVVLASIDCYASYRIETRARK